ncbi:MULTISPECIES: hypothetical protein [Streptomyces]|uniref:hypothetical protein n=1 Tax=Streptomyces TaxID=1883 RepID=UPI0036692719
MTLPMNLVPFYELTAYRPSDGASCTIDFQLGGELMPDSQGFAKKIQDLINTELGEDAISTLTYYNTVVQTVRQVDNNPPVPDPVPEEPPTDPGSGDQATPEDPVPVPDPTPEHPVDPTPTDPATDTSTDTDPATDTTTEPPATDTSTTQ